MSLKRKFQYVYTISSAVIAAALVLGILLSVKGMDMLTNTLDNNEKAIELYRAVTKEHNTLKLYFEDAQTILPEQIDEVRNDTKRILKKIPADYNGMNEEQYIVIQSIHNTYDSYDTIYRSITESNLSEKEYRNAIDNCYKAQNYLEDYVKKYESITVSLGNEQYNGQKKLFYIIPVICIIIAFVVIVLFIWIRLFMSRSIVKPILMLSDEARRISMNDYSGDDIIIKGDDEISLLIKEFTEMKHSTKNYIVTLKEKHKVEQQLEHMRFEMLKNQINPHFLFNTLNLIAGTAEIEDAVTTEKMINTLSRLFRYNLKTQTSIMSLEQEVKIMDDYMYLQQMRFGQRIKYMCDVDKECMDELVPAFVLQPLIENAIIHGLSSSSKGGLIYVRCFKKEDKMWLSVADTGIGIERDKLKNIRRYIDNIFLSPDTKPAATAENDNKSDADNGIKRKTVGVGIGNIAYRIKGMYNNSGIKIYSVKERGTVIQIFFDNYSK